MPNGAQEFQESITEELHTTKNRVRFLIGDANWGDEGRYKEAILKNVLRKFLPSHISVASGFIVKSDSPSESIVSKQIDILLYDNRIPVLFSEGDFVITTCSAVLGIIEVKTTITTGTFSNIVANLESSLNRFPELFNPLRERIFVGIFAFDFSGNINSEVLDRCLKSSHKLINHLSLGKNCFIRLWNKSEDSPTVPSVDCIYDFYNVYNLTNLSFSYFISNILHLCTPSKLNDRYWYSFPIEGTKEINRNRTICLDPGP